MERPHEQITKRVTKPVRVDEDRHQRLKLEAVKRKITISALLEEMVDDYFLFIDRAVTEVYDPL